MKKVKLFLTAFPMAGRTFYSPKMRQFVQVKAMFLKGAECGGFCTYYEDSHTNIERQMISYGFLADCELVGEIDTFKYAKLEQIAKGCFAWRGK